MLRDIAVFVQVASLTILHRFTFHRGVVTSYTRDSPLCGLRSGKSLTLHISSLYIEKLTPLNQIVAKYDIHLGYMP